MGRPTSDVWGGATGQGHRRRWQGTGGLWRRTAIMLLAVGTALASIAVPVGPTPARADEMIAFETVAPLPEVEFARADFATASVNGKTYVVGGQEPDETFTAVVATNEEYDPATDTW